MKKIIASIIFTFVIGSSIQFVVSERPFFTSFFNGLVVALLVTLLTTFLIDIWAGDKINSKEINPYERKNLRLDEEIQRRNLL